MPLPVSETECKKWAKKSWLHSPRHKLLEFPERACLSLNIVQDFLSFNNLAFDAIEAQTKIMQGFGVDLRKQVVDIEN